MSKSDAGSSPPVAIFQWVASGVIVNMCCQQVAY